MAALVMYPHADVPYSLVVSYMLNLGLDGELCLRDKKMMCFYKFTIFFGIT